MLEVAGATVATGVTSGTGAKVVIGASRNLVGVAFGAGATT